MAEQLTSFELGILTLIAITIFLIFIFSIMWLRKKYPEKGKFNAFVTAFILIAGIYLIAMLAVSVGLFTKDELRQATPYFAAALIVFWLLIYITLFWGRKPIPTKKLWHEYVLPIVDWKWHGRIYAGHGYMPAFRFNKVIRTRDHPSVREYAGLTDIVEVFFGVFKSHTRFSAIIMLNKFTGEDVYSQLNPSLDIVIRLLGREVESSYNEAIDEFTEEKEGTPKGEVEQRTEVQR